MSYSSIPDTLQHKRCVAESLDPIIRDLITRSLKHDDSKLSDPEREVFDRVTPKLRGLTYGSEEYKMSLAEMGVALDHHYEANDHHPEHFANGIKDMNLMQVVEMLADWRAATLRHDDGDLRKSIEINAERFGYGEEITNMLCNTAHDLGWLD